MAAMCALSCTEAPTGQTPTNSTPPPPLENVQAEPMPGGAKISYRLPNQTDISYVKGEFMFQGKPKTVRASVYENSLTVEGLGSVEPIEITLWLVNHSEILSPPTVTSFTPLTPPVHAISASAELRPDFGGINVRWKNPDGIEIGVFLYSQKDDGEYDNGAFTFSQAKEGEYVFRGFRDTLRTFRLQITDKWGNLSEMKEVTLTPLFEKLLDRTRHGQRALPWDNTSSQGGQNFSFLFDGVKTSTGNVSWHTQENQPLDQKGFTVPTMFTIDLGVEASLSRLILWQGRWAEWFLYGHHNPRLFEVWGIKELPTGKPDDYWKDDWKDDWILLSDCEMKKPSNSAMGTNTNEDVAQANAGHEFYTKLATVRYIRFSVKATWTGNKDNNVTIQEIEFWGNDNPGL
jgi:hypothetical protein